MSISDKLHQLKRYGLLQEKAPSSELDEHSSSIDWQEELGFDLCSDSGSGLRTREYPRSHMQGEVCLGQLSGFSPSTLCLITRVKQVPCSWKDVVFLDTETTGLSGGTGTYVFLVGLAHFTEDGFLLRQHFMPQPSTEPAFIRQVLGSLEPFSHVVTFNGKAFDLPLLSHRCTLNRTGAKPTFAGHHDLLHPARYLYGETLPSCSLSSLEENLLGVQRVDDIPGAEIPQRYFLFLDEPQPSLLSDVIEHNAHDLLSSIALMIHLMQLAKTPPDDIPPSISLSLGRLAQKGEHMQQARRFLTDAVNHASGRIYQSAARELSLLHKRAERWQQAVDLWKQMLLRMRQSQREVLNSVFAHVELAKYYEHRTGEFDRALHYTQRAIAHVKRRQRIINAENADGDSDILKQLRHREKRLQRRITSTSS